MRTRSAVLLSVGVALVMVMTAGQVLALSYSVSVKTDANSYSGNQPIIISGTISPDPGANTAVFIRVYNPNSVLVIVASASVNATTGMFQDMEVTGGTSQWVIGQYLINATWGASGPVVSGTATFVYSIPVSTGSNSSTTSSTTSSSTSSTTLSTTSSTTSTTLSTTSSTHTTTTSQTTTTTSSSSSTLTVTTTKSTTSTTSVITSISTGTPISTSTTSSTTASSSSVSPYLIGGVVTVLALVALSLMLGRRKARGADQLVPQGLIP